MILGIDLFFALFNNLAIFIALVGIYGYVIDRLKNSTWYVRQSFLGLVFGLFAVGCMYAKIPVFEGVIVDQRNTIIALSGFFGGPLAAYLSAAFASAFRLYLGGQGAFAGVVGVILAATSGVILSKRQQPFGSIPKAMTSALFATIFILPGFLFVEDFQTGLQLLKSMSGPYGLAIFIGIFTVGLLLHREENKIEIKQLLSESEEKFKALADTSPLAIYMSTGIEQKAEYINPTFIKLFGYSIGEIPTVNHWWPLAYPDENYRRKIEDEWQQKVARAIEKKSKIEPMETVVTCKDGSKKTMSWEFINIGKQNWACGLDMTERKKALDELKISEERFRALHEASFGGVIIHDNGRILDCNQGLADMTGYTNDELIGMDGLKLIAPASLDRVLHNIKSGCIERYEVDGIRKDGSLFPLSVKGKNVVYKDRDVRVIEFQDITRYKLAEKALSESEVRFRQIFETNPDPVILAKMGDGAILDVNKAFEILTGISRLDALGHNSEELGLWADNGMREPFLAQLHSDGELNNFEADFRVKSGKIRTGLLSARLLSVNDENSILIVIRDITPEKKAERAMIEMDRMKSEFISTAAHELNTPLSAMMGYTELLLAPEAFGGFTKGQKQDFLNEVYDRGEALSRIIDDLLDISRIESGQAVTLDLQKTELTDLLGKTFEFFRSNEPEYTFRLEIPDKSIKSEMLIDRHRIVQVLENLLSNAVKYSPEGREIILKGQESDEGWVVQVEDQGIGMSLEQLDRIFEKFYRADASDTAVGGLGLGMSIARQIVEAHGGNIRVESSEGKGTRAIFSLPGNTA